MSKEESGNKPVEPVNPCSSIGASTSQQKLQAQLVAQQKLQAQLAAQLQERKEQLLRDLLIAVADHPCMPWANTKVDTWITERLMDEIGDDALQFVQGSIEDIEEMRESDTWQLHVEPHCLDNGALKQGVTAVQYWNCLLDSLKLEETEENAGTSVTELLKQEYDGDGWASVADGNIAMVRIGVR